MIEEEITPVGETTTEAESSSKTFLIVIPAIVVAILVVVAISILVRVCNKKRASQPIVIKTAIHEAQQEGESESEAQKV